MEKNRDLNGLIKALKHKDTAIRHDAIIALRRIRDARSVEPLIQALKDEEPWVQHAARSALVDMGKLAVGPLIQALEQGDSAFRKDAAEIYRR